MEAYIETSCGVSNHAMETSNNQTSYTSTPNQPHSESYDQKYIS
jgi:hypothetical protein